MAESRVCLCVWAVCAYGRACVTVRAHAVVVPVRTGCGAWLLHLRQLCLFQTIVGDTADALFVGFLPLETALLCWDVCILSSFETGAAAVVAALLHICRGDLLRCTNVGTLLLTKHGSGL